MARAWMPYLTVSGRIREYLLRPSIKGDIGPIPEFCRFDDNFKMIKRKGTIVSVGNASGAVPPFSVPRLVEKNVKLLRPT